MAFRHMVSMELTDEEKLDAMPTAAAVKADAPEYPWGLRLCFDHAILEKLNLPSNCEIGDTLDLRAFAKVTSISQSDGPDGPNCRIELQITDLAVEDEDTEE